MGAKTAISWCDATFSPWIGCTEVSSGCDQCYARTLAKRYGWAKWGHGEPRRLSRDAYWRQPEKWDRRCFAEGRRMRVFCGSLMDVFDHEAPQEWREMLWTLIRATPRLDWLLLTKRLSNAAKMLPSDWGDDGYPNVWVGSSICTQAEADRDLHKLLSIPAIVHFVSYEPALDFVEFRRVGRPGGVTLDALTGAHTGPAGWTTPLPPRLPPLDWVIIGGESGPHARPFDLAWVRSVVAQCRAVSVPVFVKQDSGPRPGMQGRIPDDLWIHEFPKIDLEAA